jgi:allantoinase
MMHSGTRRIRSNNVLIGETLVPATITISKGIITHIDQSFDSSDSSDSSMESYGDLVILPGLVDAHVHLNEPGRTEWEGFETGSKAAAAGGVTTLVDMPLNAIPPTTTVDNLRIKIEAARSQIWVDVGFWGGVIPGNQADLVPLVEAGVRGFKCFLIDSGVEEFPAVSLEDVSEALQQLRNQPTILMFHAEMEGDTQLHVPSSPECYSSFLASRPDGFETRAISSVIGLAKDAPKLPLHIVHLASCHAIPLLEQAQSDGIKLSAETCFHYLSLDAESIPDKATVYKCCPPIRTKSNQDKLWEALERGTIQTVVSDHSPCTPHLKQLDTGDFFTAWGGISSVGLGLIILWTEVSRNHPAITLADISRWTSYNTAQQVGLEQHKGSIEVGKDADFCIFDPKFKWSLDQTKMQFKNKLSPYHGKEVIGKVVETIVRGQSVYTADNGFVQKPTGRLLLERRT